eukprot:snap_masked-scaffold_13-processed-gene-0.13-mRNA-1 protein AED:0.17 eAED:0.17 QI:0/-1/0/1/-1/1/1/0/195
MLQMNLETEIVFEIIRTYNFKYMQVLAMTYLRLIGKPTDIYQRLEPFLEDYRKVLVVKKNGWDVFRIDEFVEGLLTEEIWMNISFPRLPKREDVEKVLGLKRRISLLELQMEHADNKSVDEKISIVEQDQSTKKKRKRKKEKKKKKKVRKLVGVKNLYDLPKEIDEGEEGKGFEEEFDVDHWNEERKKLGLKPLS